MDDVSKLIKGHEYDYLDNVQVYIHLFVHIMLGMVTKRGKV